MSRVAIPVNHIEFVEGGDTLWVHNDQGMTVLRIKLLRSKFRTTRECQNPCSHADISVPVATGARPSDCDVVVCLADDACDPLSLGARDAS